MISLPILCYFPESPYWLIEQDKHVRALKSLEFFRGPEYEISAEIQEIQQKHLQKLQSKKSWTWSLQRLFSPAFLKPFSCIGIIWRLNMFSGFHAFANYIHEIMEDSGSPIGKVSHLSFFLKIWPLDG